MKFLKTNILNYKQKNEIIDLWNNEYPKKLKHENFDSFNLYLKNLNEQNHIVLIDENDCVKGWYFDFIRENKKWFAMILDSKIKGKGLGTKLLNEAKLKEKELNGWVIDHNNDLKENDTIDHISRITLDNRKCNLRIASQAIQNYNQNKKKRKVILPENCNINPNEIPKNIHYKKEKSGNGFRERFEISFKIDGKRIRKNSTSAGHYSLRIKLLHAIYILKKMRKKYPHIIKFTTKHFAQDIKLRKSFNNILKLSNFDKDMINKNLVEENIKPKYVKGTKEERDTVKTYLII